MQDPITHSDRDIGRVEVKETTCYMCACRCGIRVHLRDGEVRYIEGNPNHPLNQGVICAKGSSGIMKQYSPARLTQPLRRRRGAERGESQFEPISWDEAFTLLEERLRKLRAEDPKRFALFTGRDQMQAIIHEIIKQGLYDREFLIQYTNAAELVVDDETRDDHGLFPEASGTAHHSRARSHRARSRPQARMRCSPTPRWMACPWVGRPSRRICSSTMPVSRCVSTRHFPGNIRCRYTA